MDIGRPTHKFATNVSFAFYRPDQIRKISVKKITNPILFDELNRPTEGGLYDLSLGPLERSSRCRTCDCLGFECLGHFGHIDLCVPVYNPVNFPTMMNVLKNTCCYCHQFLLPKYQVKIYAAKLKLLDCGMLLQSHQLDSIMNEHLLTSTSTALVNDHELPGRTADKVEANNYYHSIRQISTQFKGKLNNGSTITDTDQYREFCSAVDQFVDKCIAEDTACVAPNGNSNAIHQERMRLINQFFTSKLNRKCSNCGGINTKIRSLDNTKVFEYPLGKKHQSEMHQKGFQQQGLFSFSSDKIKKEKSLDDASEAENQSLIDAESDLALLGKSGDMKFITPLKVQQLFNALWIKEGEILDEILGSVPTEFSIQNNERRKQRISHAEMFFLFVIAVPPSRFRPMNVMGDETFEHPQNTYFTEIIKTNLRIIELQKDSRFSVKSTLLKSFVDTWIYLQTQTLYLFDSTKNQQGRTGGFGKLAPAGIKQILEKKEGLFRKHMMGKRVNFAARTVISPDPNIQTNEIGIPMVFAKKLTYPEPVTRYNFGELRQYVVNGVNIYPGASHVQREDGSLISLANLSVDERTALANQLLTPTGTDSSLAADSGLNKKVLRHLRNGDILLLNRQPTLHKPSIMAHKCIVLQNEKVLRMHYANCDAYNADFDGDEMNVHFPQNELARAEGYNIASTDFQYLVPTDGEPLRGLIQDHIGTCVLLTKRDTFLTREEYQQLLYGCLPESHRILTNGRIKLIPPTIIKPTPLWTGKQIVSSLLCNLIGDSLPGINMTSNCKIPPKMWPNPEDAVVIVRDGYLITGVLDKSQLGATAYGITHSIQELYGGGTANLFLSAMGRLLTKYMQMIGFTCRMDDLMLTERANKERRSLIQESVNLGSEVSEKYAKMSENSLAGDTSIRERIFERIIRNDEALRGLDGVMKGAMNKLTSKIIQVCLPEGQMIAFPHNNMSLMTVSGAKGSNVNFSQISGLLGQQELEGRRVPIMVSGKTLPSFFPYDTRARAGGYITGRFLTGIKPQEYFFHCMAGREGLIDTAVKTSRSGYLQRCLIKHLEGLHVAYDCTVRESDDSVIQFFYGEDGLDVTKQKYIEKCEFVAQNFDAYLAKYKPDRVLDNLDTENAIEEYQQGGSSPNEAPGASSQNTYTVMSKYSPTHSLGAVSEHYSQMLESFISAHKDDLLSGRRKRGGIKGLSSKKFRALMWLKYMHSLAEPGEAVGLLAAQSIGEPSTQMTLNTFHFAGFGAKNVTLGIPRLREIIMTASKSIMTPSMTIHLLPALFEKSITNTTNHSQFNIEHDRDKIKLLCNLISKTTLKTILKDVTVTEMLLSKDVRQNLRLREYTIILDLLDEKSCLTKYNISTFEINQMVEERFLRQLLLAIMKYLKKKGNKNIEGLNKEESEEIISSFAMTKISYSSTGMHDRDDDEFGERNEREAKDDDDPENYNVNLRTKGSNGLGDSDVEDVNNDDLDSSEAKNLSRQRELSTYDEDEDEVKDTDSSDSDSSSALESEAGSGSDQEDNNDAKEDEVGLIDDGKHAHKTSKSPANTAKDPTCFKHQFLKNHHFNQSTNQIKVVLAFPAICPKIPMLDIVENLATAVILHEIKGISKCYPLEDEEVSSKNTASRTLVTEGVNFKGIWELLEFIDVNSIHSNDIYAVLKTFGVEAARTVIAREIAAVFGVYGISVDYRHLSLIADVMTFEGGYKPFNRYGMELPDSPFQQMSFETTMHFLRKSATFSSIDYLNSPSSRIVMGLPTHVGTGNFEVMHKFDYTN